jgi:hypothetical protein
MVKRRWMSSIVATLLLGGCFSGEPTKALIVTSECGRPVWLRVYEEAGAAAEVFEGRRPERLDAGAVYESTVFDNDADGISLAVSPTEGEVGRIIGVPHSEGDAVRVVLQGEQCPT